jgi:hypothetical protein
MAVNSVIIIYRYTSDFNNSFYLFMYKRLIGLFTVIYSFFVEAEIK